MILVQGAGVYYGDPQYVGLGGCVGWTEDGGTVMLPSGNIDSVPKLRTKARALVRQYGLRGTVGAVIDAGMKVIPEIGYVKGIEFEFDLSAALPGSPVPTFRVSADSVSLENAFLAFSMDFPTGTIVDAFTEGKDMSGLLIRFLTKRNPYGARDAVTRNELVGKLRYLIPRFGSYKTLGAWVAKQGDTVTITKKPYGRMRVANG
jgi:hypothetical protein